MGRITSFTFDAAGRMISKTLPGGSTIAYSYDVNGNLSSLTPPGRSAHALGYTAENREASYAPPNLPSGATPTSYTFDTDGRLTRVTRPGAAEAVADPLGVRGVTDPAEIFSDPEIEAIVIAASSTSHTSLILAAIAAGKAVFCEKRSNRPRAN